MVLTYAITSHSAHGITKDRVIIYYGSNKAKHALFSVPFSRAKTLNGILKKNLRENMSTVITEFLKNMNVWRQEQHTNLTTHIYMTLGFIIQLQKKSHWRK